MAASPGQADGAAAGRFLAGELENVPSMAVGDAASQYVTGAGGQKVGPGGAGQTAGAQFMYGPQVYPFVGNQPWQGGAQQHGFVQVPSPQQQQQMQYTEPLPAQLLLKRSNRACDACRKKKIRCVASETGPDRCVHCLKHGLFCTFEFHIELERKKLLHRHKRRKFRNRADVTQLHPERNIDLHEGGPSASDSTAAVEKIARKLYVLDGIATNVRRLVNESLKDVDKPTVDEDFLPRCTDKQYTTSLITAQKLKWMSKKLGRSSDSEFFRPLRDTYLNGSKLYLMQFKKLNNFTGLLPKDEEGNYQLFELPPREQAKRLMENFFEALLYTIASMVTEEECFQLLDKYYDGETLSFNKRFLLNTCLCLGANASLLINTEEAYSLRKDNYLPSSMGLRRIEHKLSVNVLYYYNRIVIHSSDITILKGLLLWKKYIECNFGLEVAYTVLSKAVSVAISLGMHRASYYNSFSMSEAYVRRVVWFYCLSSDSIYAIRLNTTPLIHKDVTDVFSNEKRLKHIQKLCTMDELKNHITEIVTFEDAFNFTLNHAQLLMMPISYYCLQLFDLEKDAQHACFSLKSISGKTFKTVFDNAMKVKESLKEWNDQLHPLMKLESFREYYKILCQQNNGGARELQFEIVCARILIYHCRYFSIAIIVDLFLLSLINDNRHCFEGKDPAPLEEKLRSEYLENARKTVKIFTSIKNEPFLYSEIIYFFYTAVFTLIFRLVEQIDDKSRDLENAYLLELLQTTHTYLVGTDGTASICDNIKWNLQLFHFTLLLKMIVVYLEEKNAFVKVFPYKAHWYDTILQQLVATSTAVKNAQFKMLSPYITHNRISTFASRMRKEYGRNFVLFLRFKEIPISLERKENMAPIPDYSLFPVADEEIDDSQDDCLDYLSSQSYFCDRDVSFLKIFREWDVL